MAEKEAAIFAQDIQHLSFHHYKTRFADQEKVSPFWRRPPALTILKNALTPTRNISISA